MRNISKDNVKTETDKNDIMNNIHKLGVQTPATIVSLN
jgi:hypothetical protein